MSEYKLFSEVIKLSVATTWDDCKKEWSLIGIELSEDKQRCLCGHYPIRELCRFSNLKNNNKIIVGNCCVNKFFENIKTNKMFVALSKGKINEELILLAKDRGMIIPSEEEFLLNVWRKRRLSSKQTIWFENLKKRIMEAFKSGRLR